MKRFAIFVITGVALLLFLAGPTAVRMHAQASATPPRQKLLLRAAG